MPRNTRGIGRPGFAFYVKEQSPQRYSSVGKCIYCGATPAYGDEHIIPDGLGGRWILPDASCRKCEGITSAIEGASLRGIFRGIRSQLGLSKRRAKARPKQIWASVKFRGKDVSHLLPIAEYPTVLVFPVFTSPGILGGVPGIRMIWTNTLSADWPTLNRRGISSVNFNVDVHRFGQLLAKIGHSFVAAEIGIDNFTPLLLDLIKAKPPQDSHPLVGSEDGFELPALTLHTLRLTELEIDGVKYIAARVRLFAYLQTPAYLVIAGTLKSPSTQPP